MMLQLHDYWRSGAAWRVRIALNLKGVDYRQVPHDLRRGEQAGPAFAALNPQKLVPALDTGEAVLTQSLAIIEWLEQQHPQPPLLPAAPLARAQARAMAAVIACDTHPLHNLRVLNELRRRFGADDAQVRDWIGHWIGAGLAALETLVARHGGRHAFGDLPGLVDCCLLPQLYSAERFGVALQAYPRLLAAGAAAAAIPAIAAAHPDRQADADRP